MSQFEQQKFTTEVLDEEPTIDMSGAAGSEVVRDLQQYLEKVLTVLSAAALLSFPTASEAVRSNAPATNEVQIVTPAVLPQASEELYQSMKNQLDAAAEDETIVFNDSH